MPPDPGMREESAGRKCKSPTKWLSRSEEELC